jgi:nicotinamide mononucleotide adenylyltransferase
MINATKIGRLIAEEITNEPGPCFYPGKFKPPHKGHFKAALDLASRNYIIMVTVIISRKPIEGITPEDSLAIWNMFLQSQPSPKIKVQISTQESPIVDIINYMKKNPSANPVYVAGGDDETDDDNYMATLEQEFHNRVRAIPIHEKDGMVSAPYVRELLRTQDYEKFKETVPEAAFNRGAAPKIFKMLASKISHEPQL